MRGMRLRAYKPLCHCGDISPFRGYRGRKPLIPFLKGEGDRRSGGEVPSCKLYRSLCPTARSRRVQGRSESPWRAPQNADPFPFTLADKPVDQGMRLRAHQRAFRSPSGLLRSRHVKIIFGESGVEPLCHCGDISPFRGDRGQNPPMPLLKGEGDRRSGSEVSSCRLYRSLCPTGRSRRVQGFGAPGKLSGGQFSAENGRQPRIDWKAPGAPAGAFPHHWE